MKRLYYYLYKQLSPIGFARKIGVKIGTGCRLINVNYSSEPYLITLGNNVSATSTRFETHDGGVWVMRKQHPKIDIVKPIKIGNNVFLGFGCIVLPGVTIGDNVVVGAHSVVSKDIASNVVAAGVPARVIKSLDDYEKKAIDNSSKTKHMNKSEKKEYYQNLYSV